ncbi:hypothetical protein F7725_013734 [Dissostichus mawsoni]|uniref:SNTX MACPF/CDC-like domain-containing protein n=1 Tax=Dissostichus mawsoni TaxID=36200 RepID=A0A7J5YUA2_DISMA|nr:hypothetical protein F7725_013734 [Dissostichus mawsoni]
MHLALRKRVEKMASDLMNVAALGRPFTLGMLYDARSDTLVPGFKLWDDIVLQASVTESYQPFNDFVVSGSDTTESKSSLLNIEASLKASFMSGLIQVGGSAKYLNDEKKFKNQSRVTSVQSYHQLQGVVSYSTQIDEPQQRDLIKNGLATHVVTGILYGANAFFVFDSEKLEDRELQDMRAACKL